MWAILIQSSQLFFTAPLKFGSTLRSNTLTKLSDGCTVKEDGKNSNVSELHPFLFDGMAVRGAVVRLTDAWQEILRRRADSEAESYAAPVKNLLGEMTAAAALMHSNIKFDGALVLQIFGDGPVKLAVAEVQSDLTLRATAKVVGEVFEDMSLTQMMNTHGQGRCTMTLDAKNRPSGQAPYQGIVSLSNQEGETLPNLSTVLTQYMQHSEQIDTTFVLAANDQVAAGLLIQRLPSEGAGNLGASTSLSPEDAEEAYRRIAHLAATLTQDELLSLDLEKILHRLFWEETLLRYPCVQPKFACTCSRQRVARMLKSLGEQELHSLLAEQGKAQVSCDFCGQAYVFDAVDVGEILVKPPNQPPASQKMQ
jgi:molecular chaperone Hsp33